MCYTCNIVFYCMIWQDQTADFMLSYIVSSLRAFFHGGVSTWNLYSYLLCLVRSPFSGRCPINCTPHQAGSDATPQLGIPTKYNMYLYLLDINELSYCFRIVSVYLTLLEYKFLESSCFVLPFHSCYSTQYIMGDQKILKW